MIASVSNNAAMVPSARVAATPKGGETFETVLQSAVGGSGVSVSISSAAKSKSASTQQFDFDFTITNVNHSQEEYQAHYAEGARRISEMQGLPEGQYDFTKLTAKQAKVILGDMIMNRGIPIGKQTFGLEAFISDGVDLSGSAPTYSDKPQDVIAHIKTQSVSFPDVNGGSFGIPQDSLNWILSITRSASELNKNEFLYGMHSAIGEASRGTRS